jgi:pimeloyl-ACP methyl ester carboxylesterase
MRIAARGLSFDVRVAGPADGVAVVLLHGFPQHAGEWDLVTPALEAAGLRTYAVDQRGYSPGARPTGAADYAIAECTADAVSVMDALHLDAAHVVGHDWGAVVGWHLSVRHPARVRTLTAVSVPHPLAMAHALSSEGYVRPMLAPGALTGALGWYRAISAADLEGLGPSTVPTTFVWSDGDLAIGPTAARECARHVTGEYRFVSLAGVSHWIPDEAPQALADEVLRRIL